MEKKEKKKVLVIRKCGDCNKAMIPMLVDDFPLGLLKFYGQIVHFVRDTYSFTSQLYTGVKYPPNKFHQIDFEYIKNEIDGTPVVVEK